MTVKKKKDGICQYGSLFVANSFLPVIRHSVLKRAEGRWVYFYDAIKTQQPRTFADCSANSVLLGAKGVYVV